jgi:hypothetical protein
MTVSASLVSASKDTTLQKQPHSTKATSTPSKPSTKSKTRKFPGRWAKCSSTRPHRSLPQTTQHHCTTNPSSPLVSVPTLPVCQCPQTSKNQAAKPSQRQATSQTRRRVQPDTTATAATGTIHSSAIPHGEFQDSSYFYLSYAWPCSFSVAEIGARPGHPAYPFYDGATDGPVVSEVPSSQLRRPRGVYLEP